MQDTQLANSLSVSLRIYRALLVAYPKKFRERYEKQMVQVFRDSFKDKFCQNGVPSVIELWLQTGADLFVNGLLERLSEGSQIMSSPKITIWGGVAGAFSGLFWLMIALAPGGGGFSIVLALILGLGGFVGVYSGLSGQGGKLGLAGLALGVIGTFLLFATLGWGITSGPFSSGVAAGMDTAFTAQLILIIFLAQVTTGIGLALLGIAALRAKTLPRWRGLPLSLGLLNVALAIPGWLIFYVPLSQGHNPWVPWNPASYTPAFAAYALLGTGWLILGTMLAAHSNASVVPTPSASA